MYFLYIEDHLDPLFMNIFKCYFNELKINVESWNNLFEEMNNSILKMGLQTMILLEGKQTMGFIQFQVEELRNWFFKEKIGFIRELYVCNEYRNNKYGTQLVNKAFEHFTQNNVYKVLLTTNTAERFYLKIGFRRDDSYQAINEIPTYMINLI